MQVVRQDEPMLITAITELSRGSISETTDAFIKSLEGRLPMPPKDKRVLFSTNDAAIIYNRQELVHLPGRLYSYTSTDEGPKEELARMLVQKVNKSLVLTCTFHFPWFLWSSVVAKS